MFLAASPALDIHRFSARLPQRISAHRTAAIAAAIAVTAHVTVVASLLLIKPSPVAAPSPVLIVRTLDSAPAVALAPAAPLRELPRPARNERKAVVRQPARAATQIAAASDAATSATTLPEPAVDSAPPAPSGSNLPAASPAAESAPAASASPPRFDAGYLRNPAPVYPPLARRLGEQGKVVLRVRVDANGHPTRIEIRTGSGSSRLDEAAQDAVRNWQFVPAKRGDEALDAWVLVPIVFNLKN